jgi:hypothetical protein
MRAVIAGIQREALLGEIHNTLLKWPEPDRKIFSQAHYNGQSPEAISRSLQLDVEEVRATLKQCERRLYTALRSFHKSICDKPPRTQAGNTCLVVCEQDYAVHSLAS